ncbi:MAG: hypothetical protein VX767_03490 [Candidatus Neomarinimicrobiota bacterium]|jgi:hypothetical protein|nr:hypothetical protein [Candidatus Neomarinimicrobiota bacterium]|tara:strand:- start:258 stop:473 length:216 start_codon:yes stop_codon:yes gene_type:complete
MKKNHLYLYSFTSLLLTVPWFFFDDDSISIFGMPIWAFYSLSFTFVYACFIYFLIKKYWNIYTEDSHEEDR